MICLIIFKVDKKERSVKYFISSQEKGSQELLVGWIVFLQPTGFRQPKRAQEQGNHSTTQGSVFTELRSSVDKGAQDSWW